MRIIFASIFKNLSNPPFLSCSTSCLTSHFAGNHFQTIISFIIWPQHIFPNISSTVHLKETFTSNWPLTVPQICHALSSPTAWHPPSSSSPMLFPASSEKSTCYLPLQVVGQSCGYFTLFSNFLQLHLSVFLLFSSKHSKDLLLFQTTLNKALLPSPWWYTHCSKSKLSIILPLCWPLSWFAFER